MMKEQFLESVKSASKLPLWLLRVAAVSTLTLAIFLGVSGYKVVPNEAAAQCIPMLTIAHVNLAPTYITAAWNNKTCFDVCPAAGYSGCIMHEGYDGTAWACNRAYGHINDPFQRCLCFNG